MKTSALWLLLIVPAAVLADLPYAPDLEPTVKRVEKLSAKHHLTELARHIHEVMLASNGAPEILSKGRQLRVPVSAGLAPKGVAYFEYEYFDKTRTVRIKTLDKDRSGLAKVWWPAAERPITDFKCVLEGKTLTYTIASETETIERRFTVR